MARTMIDLGLRSEWEGRFGNPPPLEEHTTTTIVTDIYSMYSLAACPFGWVLDGRSSWIVLLATMTTALVVN